MHLNVPAQSVDSTPFSKNNQKIADTDDSVAIKIGGTVTGITADTPRIENDQKIADANGAVTIKVARN
jgi:hypothetical protein